jgi:hypothetical protein
MDRLSQIIAYEQGELDLDGFMDLFSGLVSDGTAWSLQGSYGRTAASLIEHGYLDPDGSILVMPSFDED